jgi:hypothetical protein
VHGEGPRFMHAARPCCGGRACMPRAGLRAPAARGRRGSQLLLRASCGGGAGGAGCQRARAACGLCSGRQASLPARGLLSPRARARRPPPYAAVSRPHARRRARRRSSGRSLGTRTLKRPQASRPSRSPRLGRTRWGRRRRTPRFLRRRSKAKRGWGASAAPRRPRPAGAGRPPQRLVPSLFLLGRACPCFSCPRTPLRYLLYGIVRNIVQASL